MTNNPLSELSLQQLKQAVAVRQKIESLQTELDRIVDNHATTKKNGAPRRKRKLSAAARARISAMMKARWKKFRAQKSKR